MSAREQMIERLRREIDRAAVADVAGLVTEARLEARTKVRGMLAEAIAERLLELAEHELQQPGHPASDPGDGRPRDAVPNLAEPPAPGEVGCYVYGVVRADAELDAETGVDGAHEVFLVRGESIAAVASLVPLSEFGEEALQRHLDDLSWLERRAREHERLLDRVREQATLVPMRLCTIYRDERSVREMLAREHAFLADALDRLDARAEWGVKIYMAREPAIAPTADEAEEPAGGGGSGAGYLMERQRQTRRREHADAVIQERCERAHRELADVAVEAKVNPVQPSELSDRTEPMAFNGVYLLDDTAAEELASVVVRLREELAGDGLELELTGPWPPYNFVNSPTEVGR